jgi:hypothetical protein
MSGGERDWSPDWLRNNLGLPPPSVVMEGATSLAEALAKIEGPTKTGYKYIYVSGERFQAKPYIRPGVQRGLGSFATAEEGAKQVLKLCYGDIPLPPSPKKDRNKRNDGPRMRIRRKGGCSYTSHLTLQLDRVVYRVLAEGPDRRKSRPKIVKVASTGVRKQRSVPLRQHSPQPPAVASPALRAQEDEWSTLMPMVYVDAVEAIGAADATVVAFTAM